MRKTSFAVVAVLSAAPASALVVRLPQTAATLRRAPLAMQTQARAFRPLTSTAFSLSAPRLDAPSALKLGQSVIPSAQARVAARPFAPTASLSASVRRWDSLLSSPAARERLSSEAQTMFDGKRLDGGVEGFFPAGSSLEPEFAQDVAESVEAGMELNKAVLGTLLTDADAAQARADGEQKMTATAQIIQDIKNGAQIDGMTMGLLMGMFEMASEEFYTDLYTQALDAAIAQGGVPAVERPAVLERIKPLISKLVSVQQSWQRIVVAANDKSPKYGANLLSKLEAMRGGEKVAVVVTYDGSENGAKTLRFIAEREGLSIDLMEKIGVAILRGVGIETLRVLEAQPAVEHIDLESIASIH